MSRALYRKYRSKSLKEVIGQDFITRTLENAIKSGAISHAYLFTGPRGVGKTSIARILAHTINNVPYDGQTNHLDIIEIDAASNRRIDEIRDIRDKVYIAPSQAPYKVYIIDEVHMLTKEAFNALLKTLEEPPQHAVFILATTEAHKVPETITSRTQRFSFRPVNTDALVKHLAGIAKAESITIDVAALELIAQHSEGSVRDSLSLLDQVRSYNSHITEEHVAELLGLPKASALRELTESLEKGDPQLVLAKLEDLRLSGADDSQIALELAKQLRRSFFYEDKLDHRLVALAEALLRVPGTKHPDKTLELELLKVVLQSAPAPETLVAKKSSSNEKTVAERTQSAEPKKAQPAVAKNSLDTDTWQRILIDIKASNNTLYSVLRMAQPSFQHSELCLVFAFAFHEKQLKSEKYREILHSACLKQGISYKKLRTATDKALAEQEPVQEHQAKDTNKTITSITNIFDGAEVLES